MGVLHFVGADVEVQTKAGLCKKKRMISVADESGLYVQVCTWSNAVNRFDLPAGKHVVAIKGARVVNNYGKQLNLGDDAYFAIDPPLPRVAELLSWY